MPTALRSLRPRTRKPPNPQADPRFQKVVTELKQKTATVKKHPTAKKKAAESAAAAKGPPNEKRAGAKGNQVDKIKEAPTGKPEPTSFLALLRAEIAKAMPKTLGDTEKFMKGGDSESLKGSLKGNVSEQKEKSAGGVDSATKAQPSEGGVQTKQATAIPGEPAPPSPQVAGGEGMPAPKSQEEVSLQDSKQDTDQAMKDAEVTTPQMQKANDPRFSSVLSSKEEVAKQADAGPAQYRTKETATLNTAASKATADSKKNAMGMVASKGSSKTKVLSRQEAAKAKDEAARKKVAEDIEAIYNETKTNVEGKLSKLEEEVNTIFDAGIEAALSQMKSYVEDKIFNYKLRRYLSIPIVGAARWIRDQVKGLPEEANAYYVDGRNLFTRIMDALVVRVASLVELRLREAKAEVARGQARIKTYVAGLSPELKKVGLAAEKEVAGRFTELEQSIDDKKNQLAQSLAQKYKEGFDKADAALKEIQDSNKGLVQKFIEKLAEIIKIIMEFKDKLMGILRKGWETIKLILADPIGFLGNLLSAIKQGVGQFVGNIWTHLKKGFMEWLFGALSGAGIEIPSDLSLPSILKLVLSVLGLTPARIEQEATKLLGPTAVAVIKKLIEYVKALIQGGPAKLWEQIKADIGDLKAMVIDAIQDWLITTIVKKATVKLLSMFNPAGAFVQACIMIYDTVMWIVQNASRIMAFVEAIINSVHAIATGAIGGAANWIEQALARMIPIAIGFLAGLIGLGGIGQKIRDFITKVQDKVWDAIRKALKKIIDTVKKLIGKLTGKDKDKEKGKEADPDAEKRLDSAIAAVAQAMKAPKATASTVEGKLPEIKNTYKLKSLKLARDKKGVHHVEAVINPSKRGNPSTLFTAQELKELTDTAGRFAAQIKAKGHKAQFLANPMDYLTKKLSVGDVVEAAGVEEVAAQAGGLTVLRNVYMQFVDSTGRKIGGKLPELDFLVLGTAGVQEIVSAKLKPKQFRATTDRNLLTHFQAMPLTPPGIVTYAESHFGVNKDYKNIQTANVIWNGGTSPLGSFRAAYLSRVVVSSVVVTPLTPGPDQPTGIQLVATEAQLLDKTIELIKSLL